MLINGPVGSRCVHLCIDMQAIFAAETGWHTPWIEKVRPAVFRLAAHRPENTIFTRFMPQENPQGTWARYYRRWAETTRDALAANLFALLPELAQLVPPGRCLDKYTYSPWLGTGLHTMLAEADIDTVVISGAETDVCVLAAVLGAVDLGYRVILPLDAVCSSADKTHDALLTLYQDRFGQQVEATSSEEILAAW